MIGVAVSLGLMTGPSIGGLLIEYYSWRAIFFLTVPIGLLFTFFAAKTLPTTVNGIQFTRIDWLGGLAWAVLLTALSLAITHLSSASWSKSYIIYSSIIALAALLLFIYQELVTLYPILPLQLFKKRYFSIAAVCAVLSFMVLFTAIMLTPFYLARIRQLQPFHIGLIMMAIPLSVLIIGPFAGWISDHIGRKIPATLGLVTTSAGTFFMSQIGAATPLWQIALFLGVLGCGQAMFLSPNSASVLSHAHSDHNGISAAMLATARNLGMLLGIAQASLVFSLSFSRATGGFDMKDFSPALTAPFITAFSAAFSVALVAGILGAVLSWLRGPDK